MSRQRVPPRSARDPVRRGRRSDGQRTHAAILEEATRLASVEGIRGLTLGRLAEALGVSKSGLYAHFGSKERLQLETIERAIEIIDREVTMPGSKAPPGLRRLATLVDAYFSYIGRWVFPGGCFFSSLLAEEDARSGPVHEAVVTIERSWLAELAGLVCRAQELGELSEDVAPEQLAFELDAYIELSNFHFVLFRDPAILDRGRASARAALTRAATAKGQQALRA